MGPRGHARTGSGRAGGPALGEGGRACLGLTRGALDPQQTEGFRKRWFTMDDRRLMYFKDPLVRMGRGPGAPAAWTCPPGSPA